MTDVILGDDGLARPSWAAGEELLRTYYDSEWGNPVTDEQGCYERLCLEGFQAGLSWRTVLVKREAFREHFAGFVPDTVAGFGQADLDRILADSRVIRSRPKITAAVTNAKATLTLRQSAAELRKHNPSAHTEKDEQKLSPQDDTRLLGFSLPGGLEVEDGLPALIWSFMPDRTPLPQSAAEVPTRSVESEALAKELKRRGFKFIGPVSAFAMMEAIGVVDTNLLETHKRGSSGLWEKDGTRLT